MGGITRKELALTIKKANEAYGLDLAVTYNKGNPQIFRKKNPGTFISPPKLGMVRTFYWLDAWLDGYSATQSDERRRPRWMGEEIIPALEKN